MPVIERFVGRILDAKGPLGLTEEQSDVLRAEMQRQLSERIVHALVSEAPATGEQDLITRLSGEDIDEVLAEFQDAIPDMNSIIVREMLGFEEEWQPAV